MTQLRKESLKVSLRPVYLRKRGIKTTKFAPKTPKIPGAVTVYGESVCPKKFTGKELDAETGLYYYGARYLDPKTSRWLSGDPAMGEYFPVAPVDDEAKKHNGNLPGQGGVFNYVNLHAYHYAGNNPVKYVDPDGREAWEPTTTWDSSKENEFRDKFTRNANRIADNAISKNEFIDCADLAFYALIDTAEEMGLQLTLEYYDYKIGSHQTVSSSDSRFKNKNEFLSFVKDNMGTLTLLNDRTTKKTDTILPGDLVMFDLTSDNRHRSYTGHTIIVIGYRNGTKYSVNTVQGHLVGEQLPTKEIYTLGDNRYGASPQFRSFRFDTLFR